MKTYRIDPELYEKVREKAEAEGRPVSHVVVDLLAQYVAED